MLFLWDMQYYAVCCIATDSMKPQSIVANQKHGLTGMLFVWDMQHYVVCCQATFNAKPQPCAPCNPGLCESGHPSMQATLAAL